jgi:hypothetical protein
MYSRTPSQGATVLSVLAAFFSLVDRVGHGSFREQVFLLGSS